MPRHGGKYLRIILFSLYLKKYTFFTPYQYRKVDALRNTREVVQCYAPIEGANGKMETPIANTIKRDAYAHYWLLHALRGLIQRGLLTAQPKIFSTIRRMGLLAAYPSILILYICVYVKLIFDFLRHFYYL